jgi:DNA-binding NtrC family response regulator
MDEKLKILVIDDEDIVGTRLKPALEKEGYYVEIFTESILAKARIYEFKFDIVVTDLKMANISGLELFNIIKKISPSTEVILISGFATMEIAKQALREGVRDVIAKPFKISKIKELINLICEEQKK